MQLPVQQWYLRVMIHTIPESAFVYTVASVIVNNLFGVITESDLIITNT
jgi:hypothetical protein